MKKTPSLLIVLPLYFLSFALAHAAPDGRLLYQQHCEACHGENGQGGVGIPLALTDFQAVVDDEFLEKTIRLGRPGRVMPAFNYLSDAQVQALIKYIRSFSPAVKNAVLDIRPAQGSAENGARLYAVHCTSCHGVDGEGGRGTGVTFSRPRNSPIIAPALNNTGFLEAASDGMMRHIIKTGIKDTPMPSFLEKGLSGQDIEDIISFVRGFDGKPSNKTLPEEYEAVLRMTSNHGVQQTVENLKAAVVGANFRVIRVQSLDNGFVEESAENQNAVIVYFCNFGMLNEALAIDPRIGMFLPCRFTVQERDGQVEVSALNPMRFSRLFNNTELNQVCENLRDVYLEIMENAVI